jgi:hypothetical protein
MNLHPIHVLGVIAGTICFLTTPYAYLGEVTMWVPIISGTIAAICFFLVFNLLGRMVEYTAYGVGMTINRMAVGTGYVLGGTCTDAVVGSFATITILSMVLCAVAYKMPHSAGQLLTFSFGILFAVAAVIQLFIYGQKATVKRTTESKSLLLGLGFTILVVFTALHYFGITTLDPNSIGVWAGAAGLILVIGSLLFFIKDYTIPGP